MSIEMRLTMTIRAERYGNGERFVSGKPAQVFFAADFKELALDHEFARRNAAAVATRVPKRLRQIGGCQFRLKAALCVAHLDPSARPGALPKFMPSAQTPEPRWTL